MRIPDPWDLKPHCRDYLGHKSRAALTLREYGAALRASEQLAELLVSEQDASDSPARRLYVEGHLKKASPPACAVSLLNTGCFYLYKESLLLVTFTHT